MYIIEITEHIKNDFKFIAYCRFCEKKSHHGDGYADSIYQQEVFPHRHCEHCDLDEFGELPVKEDMEND